jgi:hypothetical protein
VEAGSILSSITDRATFSMSRGTVGGTTALSWVMLDSLTKAKFWCEPGTQGATYTKFFKSRRLPVASSVIVLRSGITSRFASKHDDELLITARYFTHSKLPASSGFPCPLYCACFG